MVIYTIEDFLDAQVSKATRRNYRFGLKTFAKWYQRPVPEILKEEDPGKTLEKYWVWLKETYKGNGPRNKMNSIIQFCKFNKINPEIRKGLRINKQIPSVRDHPLEIEECRKMYEVATVEEKVILKTWLLGIRAGDASRLKWRDFDFGKPSKELKLVRIVTRKEDIEVQLYVDEEYQKLLAEYISTLIDKKNDFLLQSNKKGRLSEKQLSRKIHSLKERAGIKVREGKVFGWHLARYLRSRLGIEYDLSTTALKMMIGQSTGIFGGYGHRAKVKRTAEKLAKHMRMEPEKESKINPDIEAILEEIGIAQAKMVVERARERLKEKGLLGLQTKEELQELDPLKDWRAIIKNYIVFDEATLNPPTPSRDSRKKRKVLVKEA